MRHIPTGIEAKADSRSQLVNRKTARALLESKVSLYLSVKKDQVIASDRQDKRGSGMRGDKIKTYRLQDDVMTDHRSGKKYRMRDVLSGKVLSETILD